MISMISKDWIQRNKILLILFFCALFVRLILFGINFNHNNSNLIDTIHGDDGYYEISQGLMNGNGFTGYTTPPFTPNPLRPPVWPFLIVFFAGTFGSYWAVFIFQILMGSFIPVLGFYVAKHLVGERHARWVGWLLVFDPYSVFLSFILYTETCFTFFFLLFLLFLFRYIKDQTIRNVIWAGVFLGLATLVKPTVQYFPIIIPLIVLYALRKNLTKSLWKHLAIFLGIFILLVAPWIYRNHREFGVWGMSAQPAFNLYVYLVPTVLSIDNHTSFSTELSDFVTKDGFDVNTINLSNSKLYANKAVAVLKDHKTALAKSVVITVFTFFTHDGMLTILQYSGITIENILHQPVFSLAAHPVQLVKIISHYIVSPAILILIMRLFWILAAALFLIGSFFSLKDKDRRTLVIFPLLIVGYFALTTSINGLGVNARFRVPVNVFIFSYAVYGLYRLWHIILGKLPARIYARMKKI